MREILFRGKRADNGEWIEGDLVRSLGRTYCGDFLEAFAQIDPFTVGQYTGLTDKNGKRIFEGDIVKHEDSKHAYQIILNDTFSGYCYYRCSAFYDFTHDDLPEDYEVIGNIHDNPELLKGAQE